MNDDRVLAFLRVAKSHATGDETLVGLLRQQGWQESQIYRALGTYYEETLGVAVPSRGSRIENARDAFFYLISFITLGTWVFALVNLGNALADHYLLTGLEFYGQNLHSNIAGYLAAIIVAFPIHVIVNVLIAREAAQRPEALDSGVRKWLTYIALVVTASILLTDAIWCLTEFIRGELTVAFSIKAASLAALTGGVFWYYLGGVRMTQVNMLRERAFAAAAAIAVAAGLLLGFAVISSGRS